MKINELYPELFTKSIKILDKTNPKIVIFRLINYGEKRYLYKGKIPKFIMELKKELDSK